MRNHTKIFFVAVTIAVVTFAWILASTSNPKANLRSQAESSGTLDDNPKAAASDDLPQQPTKVVPATAERAFACEADYGTDYLDLEVVAQELAKSDNPEHLLMAALYGPDRMNEAGLHALSKAWKIDPDNRLISWNILYSCSRFPEVPICLDRTVEKHAIEADGSNGQLWARIAGFRIDRGDMSGALDAMRNATVAPRFSDYRMEHIELFGRGLAAVGNAPYRVRIIHAIGIQAAMVSNERSLFIGCRAMAAESAEWLLQCIRLGERMEIDGRSGIIVLLGQSLQMNMHLVSGDKEKEASVEERLQLTRDILQNSLSKDGDLLMNRDDEVVASYITESAAHGELRAIQFLKEEVERLKKLPGYDPCSL